jgi:protein CpxP
MKAANGDRQAMMSAMRPMQEATNAKIKALLTDEQKAALKK